MIFYPLGHVVEEIQKHEPSKEQIVLRKFTGEHFTKEEAACVWEKVIDHKWYIGERLKRDVGEHVAAIDYIENFYDLDSMRKNKKNPSDAVERIIKSFANLGRAFFISKSRVFND